MKKRIFTQHIRFVCLLLSIATAACLFAGCGLSDSSHSNAQQSVSSNTGSVHFPTCPGRPTAAYSYLQDHFEKKDLHGFELVIAVPAGEEAILYPQEGLSADGDASREVFKQTEIFFNAKISLLPIAEQDWTESLLPALLSGQHKAHILMPPIRKAGKFLTAKTCQDFSALDRYMGALYEEWFEMIDGALATKDAIGCVMLNELNRYRTKAIVTFFNRELADSLLPPSNDPSYDFLHALYREKEWTFDALCRHAQAAAKDLNNDGKMTQADRFGLVAASTDAAEALLNANGFDALKLTPQGITAGFEAPSAALIDLLGGINRLFTAKHALVSDEQNADGLPLPVAQFTQGKALFLIGELELATTQAMRSMRDKISVLPLPKIQENDQYATPLRDTVTVCLLPKTNSDCQNTAYLWPPLMALYQKLEENLMNDFTVLYTATDSDAELLVLLDCNSRYIKVAPAVSHLLSNDKLIDSYQKLLQAAVTDPSFDAASRSKRFGKEVKELLAQAD